LIERGDDLESAIRHLRLAGLSQIECVKAVRDLTGGSLGEAKEAVHFSAAWEDLRPYQEQFHRELFDGLKAASVQWEAAAEVDDVESLGLLARSRSWADRSVAGVAHIDDPEVAATVLELVLDQEDTAITVATADALLARGDGAAWRLFLRAWAIAQRKETLTDYERYLFEGLEGAFYSASLTPGKSDAMKKVVEQLTVDDTTLEPALQEVQGLVIEGL
jgi:hypothetical protein